MNGSVQNVPRLELLPLLVRHHLPPGPGALRGASLLRGELVGLSVRAAVWLYVGSVDSGQRRPRGDAIGHRKSVQDFLSSQMQVL